LDDSPTQATPFDQIAKAVAREFILPADATKNTGSLLMKQRFYAASKAVD